MKRCSNAVGLAFQTIRQLGGVDWVGYPTFDAAVNSGPSRAIRWLQAGLGIPADGIIGPVTLSTAGNSTAADVFPVCTQRMDFIADLVRRDASQARFLKGWTRRILNVAKEAIL